MTVKATFLHPPGGTFTRTAGNLGANNKALGTPCTAIVFSLVGVAWGTMSDWLVL